jgi:hypothetical protein
LSKDTPWINGRFGEFKSLENEIKVPLIFENTEHTLNFKNPEDISSPIWDLGSVFDRDDPWDLSSEEFQMTFSPLCVSSESYKHGFIHFRKPKNSKEYSNFDKIRSIIP